jgi:hypothetical protein
MLSRGNSIPLANFEVQVPNLSTHLATTECRSTIKGMKNVSLNHGSPTTRNKQTVVASQIKDFLQTDFQMILAKTDSFLHQGLGWSFEKVMELKLTIAEYVPFSGGKRSSAHPLLPAAVRKKRACLHTNMAYTQDDKCFLYCIATHMKFQRGYRDFRTFSIRNWELQTSLDLSGLSYPTSIDQINLFEQRNGFSVNVYRWVGTGTKLSAVPLQVLYLSKTVKTVPKRNHVDLLLHENHYFLITNLM